MAVANGAGAVPVQPQAPAPTQFIYNWASRPVALTAKRRTPDLLWSARQGDVYTVRKLAKINGLDLNVSYTDGWTALHYSADRPDRQGTQMVALLINAGADLNVRNNAGLTPLLLAADAANVPSAKLLLEAGSDVNAQDARGHNVLHIAARRNQPQIASWALQLGADPAAITHLTHKTPLHYAAATDALRVAELLLRSGASMAVKDTAQGDTPLHSAAREGNASVAVLLLKAGADYNVKNHDEETAVATARRHGHDNVARIITATLAEARRAWLLRLIALITRGRAELRRNSRRPLLDRMDSASRLVAATTPASSAAATQATGTTIHAATPNTAATATPAAAGRFASTNATIAALEREEGDHSAQYYNTIGHVGSAVAVLGARRPAIGIGVATATAPLAAAAVASATAADQGTATVAVTAPEPAIVQRSSPAVSRSGSFVNIPSLANNSASTGNTQEERRWQHGHTIGHVAARTARPVAASGFGPPLGLGAGIRHDSDADAAACTVPSADGIVSSARQTRPVTGTTTPTTTPPPASTGDADADRLVSSISFPRSSSFISMPLGVPLPDDYKPKQLQPATGLASAAALCMCGSGAAAAVAVALRCLPPQPEASNFTPVVPVSPAVLARANAASANATSIIGAGSPRSPAVTGGTDSNAGTSSADATVNEPSLQDVGMVVRRLADMPTHIIRRIVLML